MSAQAPGEAISPRVLFAIIARRWRLTAATFAIIVVGSLFLTAVATPTYVAEATFILLNEPENVLALVESAAFEAAAIRRLEEAGASPVLPDDGRGGVVITRAAGESEVVVTIRASSRDPQTAAATANAFLAELADQRLTLIGLTRARLWPSYYEDAGRDATLATTQLDALTDGMEYFRPLDEATIPSDGPVSPRWAVNLPAAVAGGLVIAPLVAVLERARPRASAE